MRTIYQCGRPSLFIFFLILTSSISKAQVLSAGDIAFTAYNSNSVPDEFSFVLLKNIPTGTVIYFTDNAWLEAPTSALRSGEETITWTSNSSLVAGQEIKISGLTATLSAGTGSPGTVTGTALNLSTGGDQILAFQGSIASPTFISAIHMNVYDTNFGDPVNTTAASWDAGNSNNGNGSALPPGLTTATDCIWIGTFQVSASEKDNAKFNCPGGYTTIAQVRAAVNNQANWITEDQPANTIVPPSGCNFLSVLPIRFVYFNAKLNADKTAKLEWNLSQQNNVKDYTIERSLDGVEFSQIGTLAALYTTSNTYSFNDNQVMVGENYYRIRINYYSGKPEYSAVDELTNKPTADIVIFPNPVTDHFTVRQIGAMKNKWAVLSDAFGRTRQISLTSPLQTIDMSGMPVGVYILKMEDGTVFKMAKQRK